MLDTYRKMDQIVAVSKCNEERFRAETGGTIPVCCCHNLVDDNKVRTMGAEAIPVERGPEMTFVVVGRLEPGKGVLRLSECCGKLKKEGEKLSLWVIGDGEERSKLENRTEELGLTENVRFFGAQSNPYAYMSRADLLVCASFAEGYSTVCVEANMLGIPVLSTCVDGAKEIVDDAGAGMVVGMDDDSLCDGRGACACLLLCCSGEFGDAWKGDREEGSCDGRLAVTPVAPIREARQMHCRIGRSGAGERSEGQCDAFRLLRSVGSAFAG